MYISVIIPTHNRVEILRDCLGCLERQVFPFCDFEVIVVDDASSDKTPDFLSQYKAPFAFKHFRQTVSNGPATARNTALLAAKGDIVLIINDDTLLEANALAVHMGMHEALAPQEVSVLGRFDLPKDFCETLWGYLLQNSDLLFRFPALKHDGIYGGETYWTCNISTPRHALLAAGLFDEAFCGGAWGTEDQELGHRLTRLKVPVIFRDDCRATHMHRLDIDDFANMSIVRGGGGVLMFHKHNFKSHYSESIKEADVYYWRNIPRRLENKVHELNILLKETEKIILPVNSASPPYLNKKDLPEVMQRAHSLFTLRTTELLEIMDSCIITIKELFLHIYKRDISMEEAARHLYPVCLILRYYYDNIGICAGDTIKHFIKKY